MLLLPPVEIYLAVSSLKRENINFLLSFQRTITSPVFLPSWLEKRSVESSPSCDFEVIRCQWGSYQRLVTLSQISFFFFFFFFFFFSLSSHNAFGDGGGVKWV